MPINKKHIEESYDEQAESYKTIQGMVKSLLRDIDFPLNPTCLDIGCGDGVTTFELYEKCNHHGQIYGVDISKKMIEKASENKIKLGCKEVSFLKGDAESLDFPDDMFDVVMSLNTFQFLPNKLLALKEMYRVLKPEGLLVLQHPAGKEFYKELYDLFWMIGERHREFNRLRDVLVEYSEMHDTLEEFLDRVYSVGFTDLSFFGMHRVFYKNPRTVSFSCPYPVDWLLSVPKESRDQVKAEVINEMEKLSGSYGFKLTHYQIQGSAKKPER
jgi:ubiquinone/menaquinone biosynthesis C-methylase UbiE